MDHSAGMTGPNDSGATTEDPSSADPSRAEDARLVGLALGGDRSALGAIYDRYADRVHDMCQHMLRDHDEAADVCGEVFLVAFGRLAQLREPTRLRSWLFAIARHEVYRRSARRGRIELIEEVDEMDRIAAMDREMAGAGDTPDAADAEQLVAVLRLAADGLDDRDRMVMELQLADLDGDELAAALGTSTATAYQQVHRMKERLERSIGAVMVARQGRADCAELDRLLAGWDGTFSVLWRKRVARHVDGCEVCDRRRRAVPATLLGGAAGAVPLLAAAPVSAAPASVRERVLRDAQVGTGGRGWRRDGFPPADGARRRTALIAAAVLVLLALGAVLGLLLVGGDDDLELTTAGAVSDTIVTTTSTTTTTVAPDTTTTAVPAPESVEPPVVAPPVAPDAPPADPEPPLQPDPGQPVPQPPVLTVPPSTPIPPSVRITFGPNTIHHPTPGFPDCGASTAFQVDAPTASTVVLRARWAGQEHVVALQRVGAVWVGVIEPPGTGTAAGTVEAIATDAVGGVGVSTPVGVAVADCIVPG
jgi:RNA polymerase sigma factor (sigma-70 family)